MLLNELALWVPGAHSHCRTLGDNLECTSQSHPIHGMKQRGYLHNDPVGHWWRTASAMHQWSEKALRQKKLQMLAAGKASSHDVIRARGWGGQ